MVISNALINLKLQNIVIENGKIADVFEGDCKGDIDANGNKVIPGLIDLHTHGCMGIDTMDANFKEMCRFHAENGTTSFLPTTTTYGYDALQKVCAAKTDFAGAQILGIHFEGPYVSKKYKGAQNEKFIKKPSVSEFRQFKNVKIITLAPEIEGAMEFIREVSPDCIIALGHTDCDYKTALEAIENGANCLTHTFNAMPGLHHRNPGPIGAAVEKHIYAELICDGIHVSKPVMLAAYKMFGPDRMIIISDCIRPTGLPEGEYESGGLKVIYKKGVVTLPDGTIAGSTSTLWQCVKKATEFGIPFEDAVRMASRTPAELLGIKKGQIKRGFDADLLILDENDEIKSVIIAGEIFK